MSRICREIDDQIAVFRQRRLDHARFSYVHLDADGREHGSVVSRGVIAITGVTEHGLREVLGVDVGDSETRRSGPFLRDLKNRDRNGVLLLISRPLRHSAAVGRVFQGAGWQRCKAT